MNACDDVGMCVMTYEAYEVRVSMCDDRLMNVYDDMNDVWIRVMRSV